MLSASSDPAQPWREELALKAPPWPVKVRSEDYLSDLEREWAIRRVLWRVTLVPEGTTRTLSSFAAPTTLVPMRSGLTENNLVMESIAHTPYGIELQIGFPADFTNAIDVFSCTNLVAFDWALHMSRLPSYANPVTCMDYQTGGLPVKYYTAGNADQDSDADGLSDAREFFVHHTNPLNSDSDDDGLSDGDEILTTGTDPNDADSDGDTLPDGWEALHNLDPLDATGDNGAAGDPDGDGLTNAEELALGTGPDTFNECVHIGRSDGTLVYKMARLSRPKIGRTSFVTTTPETYYLTYEVEQSSENSERITFPVGCTNYLDRTGWTNQTATVDPSAWQWDIQTDYGTDVYYDKSIPFSSRHDLYDVEKWSGANNTNSWSGHHIICQMWTNGTSTMDCECHSDVPHTEHCNESYWAPNPYSQDVVTEHENSATCIEVEGTSGEIQAVGDYSYLHVYRRETLSNEYTTEDLEGDTFSELEELADFENMNWQTLKGRSCSFPSIGSMYNYESSAYSGACAEYYMPQGETSLELTKINYGMQVADTDSTAVYIVCFMETTDLDSSDPEISRIHTVKMKGNGATLIITSDACTAEPPQENGTVGVDVLKVEITNLSGVPFSTNVRTVPGRKIPLKGKITPDGLEVTDHQWTIDGNRIMSYTQSLNEGIKVELELCDLETDTVEFYWIDGGENIEVKYEALIEGHAVSAVVNFDLERPEATLTSVTTLLDPPISTQQGYLRFGNLVPNEEGIKWNAEVTVPDIGSGQIAFVQLVNVSRTRTLKDEENTTEILTSNGQYYLDTSGSNPLYGDDATTIGGGATQTHSKSDSPGLQLYTIFEPGYQRRAVNDNFRLYLMYKPSGDESIWITLRRLDWFWSGAAVRDESDEWVMESGQSSSQNPGSANSIEMPLWQGCAQNLEWQPED